MDRSNIVSIGGAHDRLEIAVSAHENRFATRLNSFRNVAGTKRTVREAIAAVAQVPGINAIELNYPQHFAGESAAVVDWVRETGLAITALNLRYDGPDFAAGAFTHPLPANRAEAIRISCNAMDVAARSKVADVR